MSHIPSEQKLSSGDDAFLSEKYRVTAEDLHFLLFSAGEGQKGVWRRWSIGRAKRVQDCGRIGRRQKTDFLQKQGEDPQRMKHKCKSPICQVAIGGLFLHCWSRIDFFFVVSPCFTQRWTTLAKILLKESLDGPKFQNVQIKNKKITHLYKFFLSDGQVQQKANGPTISPSYFQLMSNIWFHFQMGNGSNSKFDFLKLKHSAPFLSMVTHWTWLSVKASPLLLRMFYMWLYQIITVFDALVSLIILISSRAVKKRSINENSWDVFITLKYSRSLMLFASIKFKTISGKQISLWRNFLAVTKQIRE